MSRFGTGAGCLFQGPRPAAVELRNRPGAGQAEECVRDQRSRRNDDSEQ